jgi:hypothetical protein
MGYRRQKQHLPLELSTQEFSQLWNLAEVIFLSQYPGDDSISYSRSGISERKKSFIMNYEGNTRESTNFQIL